MTDNALGIGMVVSMVDNARSDASEPGNGCRIEGSAGGEVRMAIGICRADRSVTVVASVAYWPAMMSPSSTCTAPGTRALASSAA